MSVLHRRRFLSLATAGSVGLALPSPSWSRGVDPARGRMLAFYNTHTGERLTTTFWAGGAYVSDALRDIDVILRDFRANVIRPIEPGLLDLLHRLQGALETSQPFAIISGYRTPETNAMLRGRSDGVASHSLHMDGKAIDIRVAGVPLHALRRAALSLRAGGVGYYPASDFVHVDVGRVRAW